MLCMSLDWIEFTFSECVPFEPICNLLGFDYSEFFLCDKSRYGYNCMWKHLEYDIYIYTDGNENMNSHVSIAGHSIDVVCNNKKIDSVSLVKLLYSFGRFSRIDIALDDIHEEYFSVMGVARQLRSSKYVARFKEYSVVRSFKSDDESLRGQTIYLGKRGSDTFMRIYDKRLEQLAKCPELPGLPPTCRWELELKSDSVDCFMRLMVVEGMTMQQAYAYTLSKFFRIIIKDNDRKCRCSNNRKYDGLIGDIPNCKMTSSKKILDIDKKKSWLLNSVSKSLALVNLSDPYFLDECVAHGEGCLSDKDLAYLNM